MIRDGGSLSSLSELSPHSPTDDKDYPELFSSAQFRELERRRKGLAKKLLEASENEKDYEPNGEDDIESSFGGSFASAKELNRRKMIGDQYRSMIYGSDISFHPLIQISNRIKAKHKSCLTALKTFLNSWRFNAFILFCIILNTIFLAIFNPVSNFYGIADQGNELLDVSEIVFLSIFTVEALLKIGAFGTFYPEESAYFRSGWNIMDFSLVVLGLVSELSGGNANLSALRSFRLLRTFKGMKSMSKSLSRMTKALLNSSRQLFYAISLFGIYLIVFGLIGVTLFRGALTQYCVSNETDVDLQELDFVLSDSEALQIDQKFIQLNDDRYCSEFPENFGRSCDPGFSCKRFPTNYSSSPIVSFDTFPRSVLVVVQVVTLEGWSEIMYALFDTSPWYFCLYFHIVILLGPICILNLFVIILSSNYNEITSAREFQELLAEEDDSIRAKRIYAEIIEEGKRQREEERLAELQVDTNKMVMRLMYSFETGNTVVSKEEYESYKKRIDPEDYEDWKVTAIPEIERASNRNRLKFLRQTELFKSLGSLKSTSLKETSNSTVSLSSQENLGSPQNSNNVNEKGVQFKLNETPHIFQQLSRTFSMERPVEPIGLNFITPNKTAKQNDVSSGKVGSTEAEEHKSSSADERDDSKNQVFQDLEFNDPGDNFTQPPLEKQDSALILETRKLCKRVQSLVEEDSTLESSPDIKSALSLLEGFLDNPGQATDKNAVKKARMLLSVRAYGDSNNVTQKENDDSEQVPIARGLLTDSQSVKICYTIVTNIWFKRMIVVLIGANVLMLSFIRFEQDPKQLNTIIAVNFVFTIVFSIEILLKIYGFGGTFFFKDPLNFMDFCIIFPAMVGLFVTRDNRGDTLLTVVSNLRVFRLFQIFYLPVIQPQTKSLQKLMKTIGATVQHVCPFFLLLMLFLLLFTILGLHLFGGRLFLQDDPFAFPNNTEEIPNVTSIFPSANSVRRLSALNTRSYINRLDCVEITVTDNEYIVHCPARSNYDTFLWSFVTTFQILTLENWNEVLELAVLGDNISSALVYIYYLTLVGFGAYIVLQLFLAVVIDSFNSSHSDRSKLLKKAWIKERNLLKAGTTKNSSVEKFSDDNSDDLQQLADKLATQREANQISFQPDHHIAFQRDSLLCLKPTNRFRRSCAIFINNKNVEIVIIVCIFVSCLMLAFNDDKAPVYVINLLLVIVFDIEATMKIIGFGFCLNEGSYLRDPWNVLDFIIAVAMTASYGVPSSNSAQLTSVKLLRSLRVLRPLRIVRRFESLRIVVRTLFKAVIPCMWVAVLCVVAYWVAGVISIGLFGGQLHACYECEGNICVREALLDCQNQTFGCPEHKDTLLLGTNDTDGDSIVVPLDDLGLPTYCHEYENDEYTNSDIYSDTCTNDDPEVERHFELCPRNRWLNPALFSSQRMYQRSRYNQTTVNFDTISSAMRVLFEVSMLEGWPTVMHLTADIVGVGIEPKRNASPVTTLFWVGFLFVTRFLLLQILIAVIIETFLLTNDKETGSAFMSPAQSRWVEARQRATRSKPKKGSSINSMVFYKIAISQRFDHFISFIVLANTAFLVLFPTTDTLWYQIIDYIFAFIYVAEAFIKIRGLGCLGYFSDGRNIFDFVVVASVVIDILLHLLQDLLFSDSNAAIASSILKNIEVIRVLRVVKLLYKVEGISNILNTLTSSIPTILNISFVLFLALFMFTVLAVDLFSDVFPNDEADFVFLNEYSNFNTFPKSMNTLCRMATSWNGIMHDLQKVSPNGYWFCTLFVLVFQFLLLSLFSAVVLSSFILSFDKFKNDHEVEKNIKQFSVIWTKRSRLWGRRMRRQIRKDMALEKPRSLFQESSMSDATSFVSYYRPESHCFSWKANRDYYRKEKIVSKMVKKMKDDDYLPYTEFPNLIRGLSPPLGIKGLGIENSLSDAETMKLVAKVNIPVTRTGLINYNQTLFALVDHALGSETIPVEVQQLLDYRLPEKVVSRHESLRQENAKHSLQELYAASRLQVILRNYLAVRRIRALKQQGYSEAQISSLISESRDKARAAEVFATWLQPSK